MFAIARRNGVPLRFAGVEEARSKKNAPERVPRRADR
jgi:hypothetical protein